MGFFAGRKQQGLRSPLAAQRIDAVNRLPKSDQRQLARIAQEDLDAQVRLAAARRLRDETLLTQLLDHADPALVAVAQEGLAAVAGRRLKSCSLDQGKPLIALVSEGSLGDLAIQAADAGVREAAAERLLALDQPPVQALLNLAINDQSGELAGRALARISARTQLKQVAKKARNADIRGQAEQRIAAQRAAQEAPSPQQVRRQRQQQLQVFLEEAQTLALRTSWESSGQRLQELVDAASQLTQSAQPALDETEQQLLDRLHRAQQTFADRRQRAAAAISACEAVLASAIDPQDDQQRADFASLVDAVEEEDLRPALLARYPARPRVQESAEGDGAQPQTAAPVSDQPAGPPVAIDEQALATINERAASLATSDDLRAAADAFQLLHKEWLAVVAGTPPDDPRRQPFNQSWADLKQRRRDQRAQRDVEHQQVLSQMAQIIEELKALIPRAATDGAAVVSERKALRERWRALGRAPARLVAEPKAQFRQLNDELEEALSSWFQQRDWQRFANVAPAEALCERAEALSAAHPAPATAEIDGEALLQAVKTLQQEWRQLGPLPEARNDDLWPRFRSACDQIFEALQPFFAARDAERAQHLSKRQELLERLSVVVDDQDTMGLVGSPADRDHEARRQEQVQTLQEQWKQCGPVAPAQRRELDRSWKQLLDRFYGQRRAQRAQQDAEFADNVPHKEAILDHLRAMLRDAEAAHAGMLPGRTLDEVLTKLRQARRDWRNVGMVPKSDLGRLREAWDQLNEQLEEQLADRLQAERAAEAEAATAKQQIIDELAELMKEERPDWFRDEVGALRRRWQESGRAPRNQYKALEQRWQELNNDYEQRAQQAQVES